MRDTGEMKLWLFDLAHGNLDAKTVIKGFIKHYVLNGFTISNVQDDIVFHTTYGSNGSAAALNMLNQSLKEFADLPTKDIQRCKLASSSADGFGMER